MLTARRSYRKNFVDISAYDEKFIGYDRLNAYCKRHGLEFPDNPDEICWHFLTHEKVYYNKNEIVEKRAFQGIMIHVKTPDREYMQLIPETV